MNLLACDLGGTRMKIGGVRGWSTLAVNRIHAYDPEIVILGGGIMASADVILPIVSDHVQRYAHPPWGRVREVASELGDTAAFVAGEGRWNKQFPKRQ